MIINRAKRLAGEIGLPGDKSISHRAAIIAALSKGETRIENFSTSADCRSTLDCLRQLGAEIEQEGTTVFVGGKGETGLRAPGKPLDCGNSGTTMRLLAGVLAGQNFTSILTGDESLQKRPMRRVIEPLERMGAKIESNNGCAPLTILGKNPLQAIFYDLPVPSAQVKSCVLLAGLNADGETVVVEKTPTRDHTERMLERFGAQIQSNQSKITISSRSKLSATNYTVVSDVSSAAFFLVAAACLDNSDLTLRGVGLNPTRTAVVDVLRDFGAKIEILNEREVCLEPSGDLRVSGATNFAAKSENVLRGKIIANLIDELPILAIFGTQLKNGLEIRDAAELRVKESDRISATIENLRRMNARVEEFPDGLRIEKSDLRGARLDSFGDHRIAMAFAVAGLLATGETEIAGAEECVGVSFPNFFEQLSRVGEK